MSAEFPSTQFQTAELLHFFSPKGCGYFKLSRLQTNRQPGASRYKTRQRLTSVSSGSRFPITTAWTRRVTPVISRSQPPFFFRWQASICPRSLFGSAPDAERRLPDGRGRRMEQAAAEELQMKQINGGNWVETLQISSKQFWESGNTEWQQSAVAIIAESLFTGSAIAIALRAFGASLSGRKTSFFFVEGPFRRLFADGIRRVPIVYLRLGLCALASLLAAVVRAI